MELGERIAALSDRRAHPSAPGTVDVVRKELAGFDPGSSGQGIHTAEWTERTYAECLRRAEATLTNGGRVVVDANFTDETRRRDFLNAAVWLAVPAALLWCRSSPEVAKRRVNTRRGDATVEVSDSAAARWQEFGPLTQRVAREVNADETAEETLALGRAALRAAKVV